jgi:AcrR family transcriptional regulator
MGHLAGNSTLLQKQVFSLRLVHWWCAYNKPNERSLCFNANPIFDLMTSTKSVRPPRSDNCIAGLLNSAAHLFSHHGYAATSMRDIALAANMRPGSVYYHFASKEELLVAVYSAGVDQLESAAVAALKMQTEPWDRLEALCQSHLEVVLQDSDYAQVLIRVIPNDIPTVAERLRELRKQHEDLFRSAVADLPLPPGADRDVLRLMLLGSLNWSLFWFDPNGHDSPSALASKFVGFLKEMQHA